MVYEHENNAVTVANGTTSVFMQGQKRCKRFENIGECSADEESI